MRRPFVLFALLFGAGTALGLWGYVDQLSVAILFGSMVFLWAAAVLAAAFGAARVSPWLALFLVLLLGVFSARLPRGDRSLRSVLPLDADARLRATLSGVVVAEPAAASPMRLLLQVYSVEVDGALLRVHETVPVLVYGRYWQDAPQRWQHWSFSGSLQYAPEDFRGDWFLVSGVNASHKTSPPTAVFAVWSEQLRQLAAETLRVGLEDRPDRYGVMHALLLGYRMHLPRDVQVAFRRTGTMHVFAISGLHVGIICAVLVFVINLLRVPRTCRVVVLAPVIWLYALMTGARASAIRAGVMAITYLAAPFFGRRADSWSALALASVMILAWRPDQLQDPGFIFSFTAVAGILAMLPLFDSWLQRHLLHDPFRPRDKGPEMWASILLWGGRMVSVSLAAWLSTTPLSLYYFGRFAPIALLANLIVLPLAFLIVVTGCLSLLTAATGGGGLVLLFNQANFAYVGLLTGGMRWLERIPWGFTENMHISLSAVWCCYLVLIGLVITLRKTFRDDCVAGRVYPDI